MAFDKVVDSQKLDSAIKATANAIRSKITDKSPIPWDQNLGFSEIIQKLKTTTGFLLGEFVVGDDVEITQSTPFVVSGMKIKPKHILAFYMMGSGSTNFLRGALCYFEKGERDNFLRLQSNGMISSAINQYSVVITNSGFEIYGSSDTSVSLILPGTWGYIAISEESGIGGGGGTCEGINIENATVENHTLILMSE
jgi:hypothetical protein